MSNDPLAAILDWFLEIEQWLPGAHTMVGEILYGVIPLADATDVYELADAWGTAAEQLTQAYEDVRSAADAIVEGWTGDGAAELFREQWHAYLGALSATAQSAAAMQQGVQQYGVQVELMKFMTALNLLLLAYTLLALIMAALYSFGISLGGAVPAFMSFQTAVSAAASKALGAIGNIVFRASIRPLTLVLGRAVPAAVSTAARRALPAVGGAVTRAVVPPVVRTALPGLARRVATRGIGRSVSSRLAAQTLRGAGGRRLRMELAGEVAEGAARYVAGQGAGRAGSWAAGRVAATGARHLGARATLAVRSELAREIQRQMLIRAGSNTAMRASGSAAIRQAAAAQVGRLALGRELAEYVGIRVAFGAGFLGGGNMVAQFAQIAEGNRSGMEWGQVARGTVEGAAFAAGMWGGLAGHTVGGAVAGGLVAAAYEGYEYLSAEEGTPGREFDWNEVGHRTLQGAAMGVIAGADVQISTMRLSGGFKIGENVHVLPGDAGGLNIVAADGGGRVIALGDAGYAYHHPFGDGASLNVLAEGMGRQPGVAEAFRSFLPDGGGPQAPHGPDPSTFRPVEAAQAPPVAQRPGTQLPPGDVGIRDGAPGRPSDGGGGGPRQPASQAPSGSAGPRAPERLPAGDGPPPPGERVRIPGGDPAPRPVDPAPRPVDPAPRPVDPAPPPAPDRVPSGEAPGRGDGGPSGPGVRTEADPVATDRASAEAPGRDGPPPPDRTPGENDRPGDSDPPPGDSGRPPGEDATPTDQGPGPDASTGGSIRPRDEVQAWDWAEQAYDRFRAEDADVADIARNLADVERADGRTGFTPDEIADVKQHLMRNEHLISDYQGGYTRQRFDASPGIAEAWIRLREGRHLDADLVLLQHEMAEAAYLRAHPDATYPEAHAHANERYNWESIEPQRTGEDLRTSWGSEPPHGNTARLPEGPGRQTGGGVQLRLPGEDGPPPGHREGVPAGESAGREQGLPVRGGVREDPAVLPAGDDLAGTGVVRGVAGETVPYRLIPVEPTPVGRVTEQPDAVAAVVDAHVGGLLDGQPPRAADQPHHATWDPNSGTLTVRFPDGLTVDVVVQVNSALPPGHPVVVRPPLALIEGGYRQVEPAGVVLPAHAPAEPGTRANLVQRQLADAWRTLHKELSDVPGLRPLDGPDPRASDPPLAALEAAGPDVPVLGPERVNFRDATPARPAEPVPLTPESVRRMLADPALPEQVGRWTREHLTVRGQDGTVVPRSADEIAAIVARLEADAARAVAGPAVADAGPPRGDGPPASPEPITAARVPDSEFHGYGRDVPDPPAVERAARTALDELLSWLPDGSPLRDTRLEITTVPADALPNGAAARSVPIDPQGRELPTGRLPDEGGGYRIEVSDRAADLVIERAVAHEVTELSAIRQRAVEGLDLSVPDALRPGEFTEGSALSPHDRGRLAEVESLARMAADPALSAHARSELTALRDHLGLRPDDPGAAARRALADPHLSADGRAALDSVGAVRAEGGRASLPGALIEIRPYFPDHWMRVSGENVHVVAPDGSVVATVRVETGGAPGGPVTTRFDPGTGEHVVRVPPRLGETSLVRALVGEVTGIVAAEVGGRPEAGGLRQLDVLAIERTRLQHQLNHDTGASPGQRRAWADESTRLTQEFRAQAERLGVLGPEKVSEGDAVRQRRDELWAAMSDVSRAIVATLADPGGATGASSKARSFLPMNDAFRRPYDALDSIRYFMEEHAPPEIKQRFEAEQLPALREFRKQALERFQRLYREFFPSTSSERALPPDRAAAAEDQVRPLAEEAQRMLEEVRAWSDATGVPELSREAFGRALEQGEQAWRERYQKYRDIAMEVVAAARYKGEPLGFIGSMQDGFRGPHKGMTRADLNVFDLDLYVIHPAEFDRLYDTIMEHRPELLSRGKIFPDPRITRSLTPELMNVVRAIREELELRFPGNRDVAKSDIVLRREPPY